jgi:hypothetical protein
MKIIIIIFLLLISTINSALELNNGETIAFEINGSSLSQDIFIDIPADANTLKVEIENGVMGSDFDLFMKFGSDFTATSFQGLLDQSDYSSNGLNDDEFFSISTALNVPLTEGRWYIGIVNFNSSSESINLTASFNSDPLTSPEIEFIFDQNMVIGTNDPCDIAGWNSNEPFTPISGNSATTLGQARKNAVLKAAELMTENLQSTVPLVIQGCWPEDLESSATEATLANAGARTLVRNSNGLIPDTWYPIALAERQAGTSACKIFTIGGDCSTFSILINFNPKIDTDEGLGSTRWYYGLDTTSQSNDPDFVATALHEMIHGLGFSSNIFIESEDGPEILTCPGNQQIMHSTGTLLCDTNDIFSSFLVQDNQDNSITALSELATDSLREQAMTNPGRLLWNSELTKSSEFNILSDVGLGLVQLYSPSTLQPGSSVSHLRRLYTELMEPFADDNIRILGLATPMLWDIGWDPRPKNSIVDVLPPPGLYYDPTHSGHGFVIEPFNDNGVYFTVFYTYQDDGTAEWFTSIPTINNNVLDGEMFKVTYDYAIDPADSNPTTLDTSTSRNLNMDFTQSALTSANCPEASTGVASWEVGSQSGKWCIQPLLGDGPSPDFGGTWWTGTDDSGWGLSMSFTQDSRIVVTMYYFDADGNPRWAQGVEGDYQAGQDLVVNMNEVVGYARDATPVSPVLTAAGTITINLSNNQGLDTDGTLITDVTYQGVEGGTWTRSDVPVKIFTKPRD